MLFLHLIILAIVQGITEFLPISSSGHLILVHRLFGNEGQSMWETNLMLDVAVHIGTLLAVLVYFRKDIFSMLAAIPQTLRLDMTHEAARLNIYIIAASIPIFIFGFVLYSLQPGWARSIEVVAFTTIVFGILMGLIDRIKPATRDTSNMTLRDAVLIGCAQALALIPGTSRSGITMTAARFMGFDRTGAAKFSFLLSIAATSAAGLVGIIGIIKSGDASLGLDAIIAGFFSFLTALAVIAFLMKWLKNHSFMSFAIYRVILGIVLIGLIYAGIF